MTLTLSHSAGTASSVPVDQPLATPTGIKMRDLLSLRLQMSEPAVTIAVVVGDRPDSLRVSDLGWSREQAAAARAQLLAFEQGWDSPEMDAYDAL